MHHWDTEWVSRRDSENNRTFFITRTVSISLVLLLLECRYNAHRAVVILWAYVTAFLAPVDLVETTAADLTESLMGGLVHTCLKADVPWMDMLPLLFMISCNTLKHHSSEPRSFKLA